MLLNTFTDTIRPVPLAAPSALVRRISWPKVRPALLLLAIIIGLFWKITLTSQYTWMDHPDMVSQVLPWFQFQAREWHGGHVPLWDPHLRAGQSLIGQVQPGAVYPFHVLLFQLPLKRGFVNPMFLNWYLVIMHFLAAWFMYLLVRDLGRSVTAALIAGIAFSCGGYLGEVGWPQMLNSAIWSPLVILFTLRSMRGSQPLTNAAISGLFLGIALLSGHHQIPTFLATLVTALWLWRIAMVHGGMRRQAVLAVSLLLLVAFLCAAVQILPAYEYGKLAYRWVNAKDPVTWQDRVPHNVHARFSMTPTSILGLVFPGIHNHTSSFVGIVAVMLAALAFGARSLAGRGPISGVAIFSAISTAGLLLALGSFSVVHGVLYAVMPNFDKARNPSTALCFVTLGIAGLAAYGFDSIACRAADRWSRGVLIALGAFAVVLWAVIFILQTARPQKELEYEWGALTALTATFCCAILCLWRSGSIGYRGFAALTLLLVVFQYGQQVGAYYIHRDDDGYFLKRMRETDDVAAFLREQPGPFRIEVNPQDVPFNFGDWYGLDEIGGGVSIMVNVFDMQGYERSSELLGRKYYVARQPPAAGDPTVVFQGASGIKVFELRHAMPRAWTVHRVIPAASKREIAAMVEKPGFDFAAAAPMTGQIPALVQCQDAPPRWLSRSSLTLELEVRMACKGMLVVSETWAPGWRVTIDQRPAEYHEVFGMIRGVVVPEGTHRVRMTYAPKSVYLGACLTLLGLMLPLLVSRGERLY